MFVRLFVFETNSHIAQKDLEPPVPTHQVLGLQACASTGVLSLLLTGKHFCVYIQALFPLLGRNLTWSWAQCGSTQTEKMLTDAQPITT